MMVGSEAPLLLLLRPSLSLLTVGTLQLTLARAHIVSQELEDRCENTNDLDNPTPESV